MKSFCSSYQFISHGRLVHTFRVERRRLDMTTDMHQLDTGETVVFVDYFGLSKKLQACHILLLNRRARAAEVRVECGRPLHSQYGLRDLHSGGRLLAGTAGQIQSGNFGHYG